MRDEVTAKLDEHIQQLLNKPALTNEDYAVLREKFRELPMKSNGSMDWAWPILLLMVFGGFGSGKSE